MQVPGRKAIGLTCGLAAWFAVSGHLYDAWYHSAVRQPRRQKALATALSRRDAGAVAQLLREGAQVNAGVDPPAPDLNPLGCTPLCIAVMREDAAAVRLLLQHGANPNNRVGQITPLMLAVEGSDIPTARLLLHAGADPNAVSCYEVTALSSAIENADGEMVALLRGAGATK